MIRDTILLVLTAAHMSYSVASPTTCPATTPKEWRTNAEKLSNVRVLAYLPGDRVDEAALPAAPPDKEWTQSGQFAQAWEIRAGAIYQADCLYLNTERFLRINLPAGQRCIGRWRTRSGKVMEGTLQFKCK